MQNQDYFYTNLRDDLDSTTQVVRRSHQQSKNKSYEPACLHRDVHRYSHFSCMKNKFKKKNSNYRTTSLLDKNYPIRHSCKHKTAKTRIPPCDNHLHDCERHHFRNKYKSPNLCRRHQQTIEEIYSQENNPQNFRKEEKM